MYEIPRIVPESVATGGDFSIVREFLLITHNLVSSDNDFREIDEFHEWASLCRIELPSSAEKIGFNGFRGCTLLNEIFSHQTIICERLMDLVDAHHFVELNFLHQLRRLDSMISVDAHCCKKLFSQSRIICERLMDLVNAYHFRELKFLHPLRRLDRIGSIDAPH
jgi:hypothetical protein